MRHFLSLFSVLLLCAASASHRCIHGDANLQADAARALTTVMRQRYAEDRVGAQAATGREPMRIVTFFADLDDPAKHCTAAGEVRPNFLGGTATCTAEDVLTDAKRAFLRDDIVPSAARRLEAVLNVTRVVGPLVVPSTTSCGADVTITPSAVSPGVSDADFVLYVTAGPLGDSLSSTLAFAAPCASDGSSPIPRPIVGRANFNPRHLTSDATEPSASNTLARDTGLHEICHALGFSPSFFGSLTTTGTIRGKSVTWFSGPVVTAACQTYFNCSTQTPCAEIEDEGPSGSSGSHWDKRMTFAELMVASGGAYLSAFTLGMFEDMGMYTPEYSRAQTLVAGREAGCPFLQERCNVAASNPFGEWCFVADEVGCTPDRRSIGPCTIAVMSTPFPPEFRYFANPNEGAVQVFTDGCPYRLPLTERRCSFAAPAANLGSLLDAGFYFGAGGRCVEVDGVRRVISQIVASVVDTVSGTSGVGNFRCLRVRCPYGGERVEMQVDTAWTACPLDGTAGTIPAPSGFVGTIECPAVPQICSDDITIGSNRVEDLPSGLATLALSSGFIYLTIAVEFNGTEWASIAAERSRVIPVENAVRIDLGVLLRVGSGALDVRRVTPRETSVLVNVGLIDDGTNALTGTVIDPALRAVLDNPSSFPTLNTVYERFGSGSVSLTGIAIVESTPLCPGLSDAVCIVVVSLTVGLSLFFILLVIVCCVCLRSPFSAENPPVVHHKYRRR